ncbi:NAD(P)H-dependent flavin oxidoreductase [Halovivax cerinus]|uniref:NAD(P)H-dependent flavin oxidoreductase n=1 Tax=Halovivax cerinus TaxID=1487865 RepID=A0ABD5NML0_9EURY|nr:nitronate monooxygenase [Halovivax cerinus]
METALTEELGIEAPIVQAPIGSATTPALAAAVSNEGGLGHLAVTWRDHDETRRVIEETTARTDAPFAVNVVLDDAATDRPTAAHLETALAAGAPIVSFSFGDATPFVEQVHDAGALAIQTVGSQEAARRAVDGGVDVVATQGIEAGGHVQSEVATTALVPRVADAVDAPIVAAGGIADGRGIAGVLALGADGAWLGTRFLGAAEANVHDRYRRRVFDATETETRLTTLYDKGWPGTSHRVLQSETIERWDAAGRPPPGERPGESDVIATDDEDEPIERYDEALATPAVDGTIDEMALYAGQSTGLVDRRQPAGAIVSELVTETAATIASLPAGQ